MLDLLTRSEQNLEQNNLKICRKDKSKWQNEITNGKIDDFLFETNLSEVWIEWCSFNHCFPVLVSTDLNFSKTNFILRSTFARSSNE